MNSHAASTSTNSTSDASLVAASPAASKEKEPFKVRAELYAPTRLAPEAFAVFRLRALAVDVIAHESLVLVLLAARSVLTANALRNSILTNSEASQPPPPTAQLPRVGILGGGHVGSAVTLTLLRHGYPSDRLAISTRQPERVPKCDALQSPQAQALYHSVLKYYDNARLGRESDVLVLCMPPSQLKSVAIQLKHALSVSDAPTLVVSALCGVSRELLQKSCGSKLVERIKVSVPKLDGGDAVSSLEVDESSAGYSVGNTSSVVEIAAKELAQDGEQLVEVLTDLGVRSCLGDDTATVNGQDAPSSNAVLEDSIRQQMRACVGDHSEDEEDSVQLMAMTGAWVSDWDAVLAVIRDQQQQERRRRKTSRVGA